MKGMEQERNTRMGIKIQSTVLSCRKRRKNGEHCQRASARLASMIEVKKQELRWARIG